MSSKLKFTVEKMSSSGGRVPAVPGEPMEQTQLLSMTAERAMRSRRLKAWASITILASVLIAGAFIGIYLLIIQSRSEDIIPPELSTVKVQKANDYLNPNDYFSQKDVLPKFVVIKAGVTQECYDVEECIVVLEEMQDNLAAIADLTPFNILSMSDGRFMYDYKWNATLDTDPDTFAIAMLGNFSDERIPLKDQVDAVINFIFYHDSLGHFDQNYIVMVNKNSNRRLLDSFKDIPHFCASCKPT